MRAIVIVTVLVLLAPTSSSEAATPMVSAGTSHSLALHKDGTLRGWGDDRGGQLASGIPRFFQTPTPVAGLPALKPGAASIACGTDHGFAIAADGALWAWGLNGVGQLGDGTFANRTSPIRLAAPANVVFAAAASSHSLAITAGGQVWSWGHRGHAGQLGRETGPMGDNLPGPVTLPRAAMMVGAGHSHSLALLDDGSVWSWGDNSVGQLGDGTATPRPLPVRVVGLEGVVRISAGALFNFALKADGSVWAWGWNAQGNLGDGTTIDRSIPVQIPGFTAVRISGNPQLFGGRSYAARADGSVWRWGEGLAAPQQVAGFSAMREVASAALHGAALDDNGAVWTYGVNDRGQLGRPQTDPSEPPAAITGLPRVVALCAGVDFTLAATEDGRVFAWGSNVHGQLAIPHPLNFTTPRAVVSVDGVKQVAASAGSFALRNDGRVWAWGFGITSTPAPTGLTGIVQVAAGVFGIVALNADGSVWTLGQNNLGQLGRLPPENDNTPRQVPGLAGVVRIAAGQYNAAAVTADGSVWVWGLNTQGRLGVASTDTCFVNPVTPVPCVRTPQRVPGITSVKDIAMSGVHILALRTDGTVWAWGANGRGALGDGTTQERVVPAPVPGLADVVALAAASDACAQGACVSAYSLALTRDGQVWSWGHNESGQLGDSTPGFRAFPRAIGGIATGVVSIAAGWRHAVAVRSDGAVLSWGDNRDGQLGDGTLLDLSRPGIVVREEGAGTLDGNDWFLRLDPAATVNIPASAVPRVLVVSRGFRTTEVVTLDATAKQKTAEAGRNVALFVLAKVPPEFFNLVKLAPGAKSAAEVRAKTGEALVFAQLTPLGWTNAQGQLIAYSHGVASAAGSAASILDGIRASSIPGARFCIGYGETSDSMLTSLTLRELLEIPGAGTVVSSAPCLLSGVYVGGPASSRLGTSVTFTASVVGLSPTGQVQFFDGNAGMPGAFTLTAVNEAVGRAQVATSSLATGMHSIAASYSGDGQNAAVSAAQSIPLRHEVVAPQGATRLELAGPTASEQGTTVTFFARVVGDRPTGTVQLKDGAANLGSPVALVDSVALFGVSSLAPGAHSISAVYSGDSGNTASTSNTVTHTVHAALATRVALASSANPAALGAPVTLRATVTGTNPTGSVAFRDGAAVLATVSLVNAVASTTLSSLSAGLHVLAADYLGDASNPAASSPALYQQVTAAAVSVPSFAARMDVPVSTLIQSNAIVLSGIGASTPISVAGGEYSIGCTAAFTTASGTVNAGQSVCVRHTSSADLAATTRTTLFVGTATAQFTSTTMSAAFRAGIATLVAHYYRAALGRTADAGGQAHWEGEALRLQSIGANAVEAFYAMAMAFFGSPEYAARGRDSNGYVTDLYATFLNRAPDAGGLAHWSQQLAGGMPREVLLAQFMFSAEFAASMRGVFGERAVRAEVDLVLDFYRGLLWRLPDSQGFAYWLQRFRAAQCAGAASVIAEVEAISSAFATSAEYALRSRNPSGYVGDLYNAFLRRGGDLAGVQFWIQQATTGARTREQVRREFVASPEFNARVNTVVGQGCL